MPSAPSTRQQRAGRDRRQISRSNPWQFPTMPMTLISLHDNYAQFQVFGLAPAMVINGEPAFRDIGTGNTLTSASLVGQMIETYWDRDFEAETQIVLAPNDPAIKTPEGGTLAPVHLHIARVPYPVQPLPTQPWIIAARIGNDLQIDMQSGGIAVVATARPSFYNITKASAPIAWAVLGSVLTLTYAGAADDGDIITYPVDDITVVIGGAAIPAHLSLPAPA